MDKITFDFKNRTAIVTGGAQGFGFDITKRFLKSGAKVIIWDNDPKALGSLSHIITFAPDFKKRLVISKPNP